MGLLGSRGRWPAWGHCHWTFSLLRPAIPSSSYFFTLPFVLDAHTAMTKIACIGESACAPPRAPGARLAPQAPPIGAGIVAAAGSSAKQRQFDCDLRRVAGARPRAARSAQHTLARCTGLRHARGAPWRRPRFSTSPSPTAPAPCPRPSCALCPPCSCSSALDSPTRPPAGAGYVGECRRRCRRQWRRVLPRRWPLLGRMRLMCIEQRHDLRCSNGAEGWQRVGA